MLERVDVGAGVDVGERGGGYVGEREDVREGVHVSASSVARDGTNIC